MQQGTLRGHGDDVRSGDRGQRSRLICTDSQWRHVAAIQALYTRMITHGAKRVPAAPRIPIVQAALKDITSLTLDVTRDGFVVLSDHVKDKAGVREAVPFPRCRPDGREVARVDE